MHIAKIGGQPPPPPPPPPLLPPPPPPLSPLPPMLPALPTLPTTPVIAPRSPRPMNPMETLFEEIRARGRQRESMSKSMANLPDAEILRIPSLPPHDEDPRKRFAREIEEAAAKRLARRTIGVPPEPIVTRVPTPATGLLAEIRGAPRGRRRREDEATNKVKRYKVMGLRCGEYLEDPDRPIDNVDVFSSLEDCESTRIYNLALEAIMNSALKYGNEVNEAQAQAKRIGDNLARESERLDRAKTLGDENDIRNYTKSVANYVLDLKVAEEKRANAQANYDKYWGFVSEYIVKPLTEGKKDDAIAFYQHLRRLKPNVESWQVEFVAQEFANYFKIPLPGYEVGGVSGLTSSQVKSVLLGSPLRACMTNDILNDIMNALAASVGSPTVATFPSSSLTTLPTPPETPETESIPTIPLTQFEEPEEIFYEAPTELVPDSKLSVTGLPELTRSHILRKGIDGVLSKLDQVDPRKLPPAAVESILDALNDTEVLASGKGETRMPGAWPEPFRYQFGGGCGCRIEKKSQGGGGCGCRIEKKWRGGTRNLRIPHRHIY